MIRTIFFITMLSTGIAFAGTNQPGGPIAKEVRHELVMLPFLDVFDNLSYGVDGGVVRPEQGGAARARSGVPEDDRSARPRPQGGNAEGWAERRDHDVRGRVVAASRGVGAEGGRDDGRDHAPRERAAGRRDQGEAPRRAPRRDQGGPRPRA